MVQGFKEAKCSQRKALEKKAHDLGFQDFSMVIGIHNVKARGKWFLTMIFMLKIGAAMGWISHEKPDCTKGELILPQEEFKLDKRENLKLGKEILLLYDVTIFSWESNHQVIDKYN